MYYDSKDVAEFVASCFLLGMLCFGCFMLGSLFGGCSNERVIIVAPEAAKVVEKEAIK